MKASTEPRRLVTPLKGTVVVAFSDCGSASALVARWLTELGAELHVRDLIRDSADSEEFRTQVGGVETLVVLEDFLPGALDAVGWGWADVSYLYPSAIYCSITGHGQHGPYSERPWSDLTVQALAGVCDSTGAPDGPPIRVGADLAQFGTSLYALVGVLAAIYFQRATGRGQHLDISAHECLVTMADSIMASVLVEGASTVPRFGNAHGMISPYNLYPTNDGHVVIATISNSQWHKLLEVMGRQDLAADDSLASPAARAASPFVDDAVGEWTSVRTSHEVVEALVDAGLPAGYVNDLEKARSLCRRRARDLDEPMLGSLTGLTTWPAPPAGFPLAAELARPWAPGRLSRNGARTSSAPLQAEVSSLKALAGVRVLDVGHIHAVPVASRVLSELGATVIRVEQPGGDPTRRVAPMVGDTGYMFGVYNCNKLGVELDLKATDREALARLVATSDIVMENHTPSGAVKLGLDHRSIHAIDPDVVHVGLSGYGNGSDLSRYPAYDLAIQAMSGLMILNADASGLPMKTGPSVMDRLSALVVAASALAMLCDRTPTGPRFADVAMLDVATSLSELGRAERPDLLLPRPFDQVAPTPDGYLTVSAVTAEHRAALWDVVGRDDVVPDDHGLRDALRAFAAATRLGTAVDTLTAAGVPAAPVIALADLQRDPALRERGTFLDVATPNAGPVRVLQSPLHLSVTPGKILRFAPRLGEHTSQILESEPA